ncbi:MAG: putative selenium-dependent hydroxylase accessory protein YqeC [Lachnospiraceae bacterium]|nr:putative selenium-dependent hydroxylase accessory protein YqeC [Lachnospiraceae bacterium]
MRKFSDRNNIGAGGNNNVENDNDVNTSAVTGKTTENTTGNIIGPPGIVICTTTHIMWPDNMPVFAPEISGRGGEEPEIAHGLETFLRENAGHPVCVGFPDPDNPAKLVSFPIETIKQAAGENAYILVEADGAKHLPLKAHNENEPVIPGNSTKVILVIGAEGFGRPIAEAVHRPEIFAKLAGADADAIVTPEIFAKVFKAEQGKFGDHPLQIFMNCRNEHTAHKHDTCATDIEVETKEREGEGFSGESGKKATEGEKYTEPGDNETEAGNAKEITSNECCRYVEEITLNKCLRYAEEIARLTGVEVYAGCAGSGTAIRCNAG